MVNANVIRFNVILSAYHFTKDGYKNIAHGHIGTEGSTEY